MNFTRFMVPIVDEHTAYMRGFACGQEGPNEVNCHFSTFATPALTAAWERGKRAAEREQDGPNSGSGSEKNA